MNNRDQIEQQALAAFVRKMNGCYTGSPTNHPKWPTYRDGYLAAKEQQTGKEGALCAKCNTPELCREYGKACEHK